MRQLGAERIDMDSQIPSAEALEWMRDNANAREMEAEIFARRGEHDMAKLSRDCAWAFRYVAEKAKDAGAALTPNMAGEGD
jgi:hypothetical protein